jgi:hypothetical protein
MCRLLDDFPLTLHLALRIGKWWLGTGNVCNVWDAADTFILLKVSKMEVKYVLNNFNLMDWDFVDNHWQVPAT